MESEPWNLSRAVGLGAVRSAGAAPPHCAHRMRERIDSSSDLMMVMHSSEVKTSMSTTM